VQVVGQPDDHDIGLRVADGRRHVRRPARDTPLLGELPGAVFRAGVDGCHAVLPPPAMEGHRVEHPDQAGA